MAKYALNKTNSDVCALSTWLEINTRFTFIFKSYLKNDLGLIYAMTDNDYITVSSISAALPIVGFIDTFSCEKGNLYNSNNKLPPSQTF